MKKIIQITFLLILVNSLTYAQDNFTETNNFQYKFNIGEMVNLSLMRDCSLTIGRVEKIDGNNISYLIEEKLFGGKELKNNIILTYEKPLPTSRFNSESYSPWLFVNIKKNERLLVSHCGEKNNYGLIVSDQDLFPNIKNVISFYDMYQKNPNTIKKLPGLIQENNSEIFLGYVVSFISRDGIYKDKEISALILSQLMFEDQIPTNNYGLANIALRRILVKKDSLTGEVRKEVLNRIIKAGGNNRKSSRQALITLIYLVNNANLDLSQYLSSEDKKRLLDNFKKLPLEKISLQEKLKFENILKKETSE